MYLITNLNTTKIIGDPRKSGSKNTTFSFNHGINDFLGFTGYYNITKISALSVTIFNSSCEA